MWADFDFTIYDLDCQQNLFLKKSIDYIDDIDYYH